MSRRRSAVLAAGVILLLFLAAVAFVVRHAVDFPQWDEWFFAPFLERVARGEATWHDFLAPHNEHVVLVPRLLLCGLVFTVGWDVRYGMAAGLVFAGLTLLALRRLGRQTDVPGATAVAEITDVACAALLFSLAQWENWLWGMQSAWFLVNLCVVVALLAVAPRSGPLPRWAVPLALAACTVASLTTAQGPFAWLALLPLVLARPANGPGRLRPATWLLGLVACWAIIVAELPPGRSGLQAANVLAAPGRAVAFFLVLLGSPFAPGEAPGIVIGAAAALAFFFLSAAALRGDARTSALPFVGLGIFALLVSAATTWARVGHGLGYAFNSRYTTNAVMLWVAIAHLLRLALRGWPERRAMLLAGALVVVLGLGLANSSQAGLENGRAEYQHRSASKSCIELGAVLEHTRLTDGCSLYSFPRAGGTRNRWEGLVAAGVLKAPPPPTVIGEADPRAGMLLAADPPADRASVTGWATVTGEGPPTLLLLSANEGRSFMAALPLEIGQSHLGASVEPLSTGRVSWRIPLRENGGALPGTPLSAWVLDPRPRIVRRLGGTASIPGNPGASASVSSPDDTDRAQMGDLDGGRGPVRRGGGSTSGRGDDTPSADRARRAVADHRAPGDRWEPRRSRVEGRSALPRGVADLQPAERIVHRAADRSARGLRRPRALLRLPLHRS